MGFIIYLGGNVLLECGKIVTTYYKEPYDEMYDSSWLITRTWWSCINYCFEFIICQLVIRENRLSYYSMVFPQVLNDSAGYAKITDFLVTLITDQYYDVRIKWSNLMFLHQALLLKGCKGLKNISFALPSCIIINYSLALLVSCRFII